MIINQVISFIVLEIAIVSGLICFYTAFTKTKSYNSPDKFMAPLLLGVLSFIVAGFCISGYIQSDKIENKLSYYESITPIEQQYEFNQKKQELEKTKNN